MGVFFSEINEICCEKCDIFIVYLFWALYIPYILLIYNTFEAIACENIDKNTNINLNECSDVNVLK